MTDIILKYGSKLIVLFFCIPIHEFAHAWAATKLGDRTPGNQGRLTLNPFAHLDIWGSLMILFVGFGWGKPVQVNPMNFKSYRKGMALTATAGPISNIIMAFIFVVFYKVVVALPATSSAIFWLGLIFYYIAVINLGLAVFNLIPVAPLDGQKILSYFTSPKVNRFMEMYENYIYIGLIILIFTGVLDRPLGALQNFAFLILDKLTFWVDPIINAIVG